MSQGRPFSTRVASSNDERAVRMLLGSTTDIFDCMLVAASVPENLIVGAGGLTQSVRPKPPAGPGVALHVIAPCRSQGIGRALLDQLLARAARRGAAAVYASQKVDYGSDEMQAWTALGFSPCETVEHHELPLDQFESQLAPLYERMRERGKIPASARIIPLYDAQLSEVLKLHLATLGGDAKSLSQKLRGEVRGAFAPRYSQVLMVGDRVAGFILGHRVSCETVHVDANVVAPDMRGSWANVWLKLAATRGAIQWGIKKFVFTTFDHYQDTRSFTEKLGGVTVRKLVLMHRPLTACHANAVCGE